MSESTTMQRGPANFRHRLLMGVCTAALTALVYVPGAAVADDDADRPTVWIELGGLLDRLDDPVTPFAPSFFDTITKNGFKSPLEAGKSPIYSNGAEGSISFAPGASDWVFSASLRYGRANGNRYLHPQPKAQVTHFEIAGKYYTKTSPPRYVETKSRSSEAHLIADFQAGKDVGVGMFGAGSSSTISVGVRFAQFSEKANITARARPDAHFVKQSFYGYQFPFNFYHEYFGSVQRAAGFHGLGPSISWKAAAPVAGNPQAGLLAFDWGANAALLFGRQKAVTHHYSKGSYHYYQQSPKYILKQLPTNHGTGDRSRSVIVPNLGAFAGLSYNFPNAKISVGYRGDFFFGAVDGGLDTAKKETRGFYGPFATISVGLGG